MQVSNRIKQATACRIIELTEAEKDIYRGAGHRLARFVDGHLVELFDPTDTPFLADAQVMADEAIAATTAWLKSAEGEVWFVMCSGYELCEPQRLALDDAAMLARLMSAIGDSFFD